MWIEILRNNKIKVVFYVKVTEAIKWIYITKTSKKLLENPLTLAFIYYIINKHVKRCVEVECGYTLEKTGDGGNFYGVCHG